MSWGGCSNLRTYCKLHFQESLLHLGWLRLNSRSWSSSFCRACGSVRARASCTAPVASITHVLCKAQRQLRVVVRFGFHIQGGRFSLEVVASSIPLHTISSRCRFAICPRRRRRRRRRVANDSSGDDDDHTAMTGSITTTRAPCSQGSASYVVVFCCVCVQVFLCVGHHLGFSGADHSPRSFTSPHPRPR